MEATKQELDDLLCSVATILDGWHQDGTEWSDYDESVRERVIEFRYKYTFTPIPDPEGATVPIKHWASLCTILTNKNKELSTLRSELSAAQEKNKRWGRSFDLYHAAIMRGEEMYRKTHPDCSEYDSPDTAHMVEDLCNRIVALEEENKKLRETVIKGLQDIKRAAQVNIDEDDVFNAAETMGDALEKSFILTDALLSAITPPESGEQTK